MKNFVYATLFAVAMAASGCGGTKQVAANQQPDLTHPKPLPASDWAEKIQSAKEEAAYIKAITELENAKADAAYQEKVRREKEKIADEAAISEANGKLNQVKRDSKATEMPCQRYDDDEWFYATGVREFKRSSINTAPTALLRSAQFQMRQKLAYIYKAVMKDYADQMDTDEGNYTDEHIERLGISMIRSVVNDTYEVCRKDEDIDENNIRMYMTIKVSKKDFGDMMVKTLSQEKQYQVREKQENFYKSYGHIIEDSNNPKYNKQVPEN